MLVCVLVTHSHISNVFPTKCLILIHQLLRCPLSIVNTYWYVLLQNTTSINCPPPPTTNWPIIQNTARRLRRPRARYRPSLWCLAKNTADDRVRLAAHSMIRLPPIRMRTQRRRRASVAPVRTVRSNNHKQCTKAAQQVQRR